MTDKIFSCFGNYYRCPVDTGSWYQSLECTRRMIGFNASARTILIELAVEDIPDGGFSRELSTKEFWLPVQNCKLILRSLDDDLSDAEKQELLKMGFRITSPRNYLLDETDNNRLFRMHEIGAVSQFLTSRHFSIGLLPKSDYIIKNTTKNNKL